RLVRGMEMRGGGDWVGVGGVPGTTVWWALPHGEAGEHQAGVLVFAPAAPIYFINADYVRGKLMQAVKAVRQPCRLVVIEGNGIIDVDFTGSQVLQQIIADLHAQNI